jgi:hypothetical protein
MCSIYGPLLESQALPQKSRSMPASVMYRRILARLEEAEVSELNPHFRDDYRIAWITVLEAWRGSPSPHVVATYTVLGRHPDRVWDWITAWRKAKLGKNYSAWYDENGNLRPELPISTAISPRKPVQSERRLSPRPDEESAA